MKKLTPLVTTALTLVALRSAAAPNPTPPGADVGALSITLATAGIDDKSYPALAAGIARMIRKDERLFATVSASYGAANSAHIADVGVVLSDLKCGVDVIARRAYIGNGFTDFAVRKDISCSRASTVNALFVQNRGESVSNDLFLAEKSARDVRTTLMASYRTYAGNVRMFTGGASAGTVFGMRVGNRPESTHAQTSARVPDDLAGIVVSGAWRLLDYSPASGSHQQAGEVIIGAAIQQRYPRVSNDGRHLLRSQWKVGMEWGLANVITRGRSTNAYVRYRIEPPVADVGSGDNALRDFAQRSWELTVFMGRTPNDQHYGGARVAKTF